MSQDLHLKNVVHGEENMDHSQNDMYYIVYRILIATYPRHLYNPAYATAHAPVNVHNMLCTLLVDKNNYYNGSHLGLSLS